MYLHFNNYCSLTLKSSSRSISSHRITIRRHENGIHFVPLSDPEPVLENGLVSFSIGKCEDEDSVSESVRPSPFEQIAIGISKYSNELHEIKLQLFVEILAIQYKVKLIMLFTHFTQKMLPFLKPPN